MIDRIRNKKDIFRKFGIIVCMVWIALSAVSCTKSLDKMSAAELLDLGEKCLVEMDYEQAVIYFDKLITIEADNSRNYLGLAEAYLGLDDVDRAIEVLRQGLNQLPESTEIKDKLDELQEIETTPVAIETSEYESEEELTDITETEEEHKNIIDTLSDAEYKKLSIFFSNFSEVHFEDFDSVYYTSEQLIPFAIWHVYRNNEKEVIPVSDELYNAKISAQIIENIINKYFEIKVEHQSVGYDDIPNSWKYGKYDYLYEDGYYYFIPADGAPLSWSEVEEFYDNGDGTFYAVTKEWTSHAVSAQYERRKYWEQSIHPDNVWEGAVAGGGHIAVVAPYSYGGKDTYKMLKWTVKN